MRSATSSRLTDEIPTLLSLETLGEDDLAVDH
jgi:hypothetical protein